MSEYYIVLERAQSQIVQGRYDDRLRVQLTVTEVGGDGLQVAVFIVRRHTETTVRGEAREIDRFQGVASPYDLASYPEGAPVEGQHFPFFLTDTITLEFPARSTMDAALARIYSDLEALTQRMASHAVLSTEASLCFPECPVTDSDSDS